MKTKKLISEEELHHYPFGYKFLFLPQKKSKPVKGFLLKSENIQNIQNPHATQDIMLKIISKIVSK
jgi:hypothetical protein